MSIANKSRNRGPDGKLLRKYRRTYLPNLGSTPKWWRKLYMTRPRRRENRRACRAILKGHDPDGLILPLGNCKPHVYYW